MSLKRKGNQKDGQNHKNKNMKKIILILSLLALLSCGSSTPDESDVKDVARTVILRSVKNIKSTEFYHNEIITTYQDSLFDYKETISATNSFGGAIDQVVTTRLKWNGGNPSEITNWAVIDIQFANR